MNQKALKYHLENRHATWLELFFDLVFVAGISVITHNLAHTHNGHIDIQRLLIFPMEFLSIWWIWATHTLYSNRFDTDDKIHRIMSFFVMFFMMAISTFFDENLLQNYNSFISLYVTSRLLLAGLYLSSTNKLNDSNLFAKIIGIRIIIGAIISGSSVFFEPSLYQIIFISGIIFEMIIGSILGAKMDDIDPIHREHLVERIGLLTIILLGESVISLVSSLRGIQWNIHNIIAATSGFTIISMIWWIYYENFNIMERLKSLTHGFLLVYSHIILAIGLIIIANLIRHTILNDLSISHFRILSITGAIFFYVGIQFVYFISLPPYRINMLVNTSIPIIITIISAFLPTPIHSLLGLMLGLFVYAFLGFKATTEKNISRYIEK